MPNLPQGQNYYDLYSFLDAWEERYGKLSPEQSVRFLRDPRLVDIVLHHKYSVEASLDEFKTFDDILNDLRLKADFNTEFVEISPEDLGMADPVPWATSLEDLGLE